MNMTWRPLGDWIQYIVTREQACNMYVRDRSKKVFGLLAYEPETRKVLYHNFKDVIGDNHEPEVMQNFLKSHKNPSLPDHVFVMRYGKIIAETVRGENNYMKLKAYDGLGLDYVLYETEGNGYEVEWW